MNDDYDENSDEMIMDDNNLDCGCDDYDAEIYQTDLCNIASEICFNWQAND